MNKLWFAKLVLITFILIALFMISSYSAIADWSIIDIGTYEKLWDVWGSSKDDVFIGAHDGTIYHYDGLSWSSMTTGVHRSIRGIWGFSSDDVFAVGYNGIVIHYNGKGWSSTHINGLPTFNSAWGSSPTDVFAVGYHEKKGVIYHYDGVAWKGSCSTEVWLWDIWGSSGSDIFAVGSEGTILHYDDIPSGGLPPGWSKMNSGVTSHLYGVWGSSGSNVFAVGFSAESGTVDYGTILHYDGNSWSEMYRWEDYSLQDVWGSSENDVYAVGNAGLVIHYDGNPEGTWSKVDSNPSSTLNAIWGSSSEDVYVVGPEGVVNHYIGDPQPTTTTISVTTTTSINTTTPVTTISITTTAPSPQPCLSESIYGEYSEETERLRSFRDNMLSQTPVGRELIRLYYEWNPVIVKATQDDEEFKEEIKEMFDGVSTLIRVEVK